MAFKEKEKKMYDGGDTTQFPQGGYPGAGSNNIQALMQLIKSGGTSPFLPGGSVSDSIFNKSLDDSAQATPDQTINTLKNGLGMSSSAPSPTPSSSPDSDPAFMAQLQNPPASFNQPGGIGPSAPPPAPPPAPPSPLPSGGGAPNVGTVLKSASQTPPTNYSLYGDVSADQRMKLAQDVLAKQQGAGTAILSGVAGIGDALAKSYGHDPSANAQGKVREIQQQQGQQALQNVDTARQQKVQDVQAKMTLMEADPNSVMSQGFRQFLKSQGVKVPSGMSAAMLKAQFPDMGKLLEAKIMASTQAGAQGVEAGKVLDTEGMITRAVNGLFGNVGQDYLAGRVGGTSGASSAPSSAGWSVKH